LDRKKTYFISDAHLGVDGDYSSKERENMLVDWLEEVSQDASAIYFLGDIFDHWFEYKHVIPRGFTSFIAKLVELRKKDIPLYYFTGNHDMWMFSFFEKDLGIPVLRKPLLMELEGKKIYLAHGHGLSSAPLGDRLMKSLFDNSFLQWCFARLHPNLALSIMRFFSRRSRTANAYKDEVFEARKEYMIDYSESLLHQHSDLDYVIMGHRHLTIDYTLSNGKTRYINLGDWVKYFSYAVLSAGELKIEFYRNEYPIYPT
jgi:UDP-2,3-diacylglucosamine hydrolase